MNYELHFLRRPQVEAMTSLSRATIYKWMRLNKFPKSISIAPKIVVWKKSDVEQWMSDQIDQVLVAA